MTGRFDLHNQLDKPEGLAGFPKVGCRFFRYVLAVLRDDQKFFLALRIDFLLRHIEGHFSVTMSVIDTCVVGDDDGIVELAFFDGRRIVRIEGCFLFSCFFDDAAEADSQYFAVVDADVADPVVVIVPNGEDAEILAFLAGVGHQ